MLIKLFTIIGAVILICILVYVLILSSYNVIVYGKPFPSQLDMLYTYTKYRLKTAKKLGDAKDIETCTAILNAIKNNSYE